ncbi:MAG: 30S ribosomal protein S16 [Deltaproteobacteria bacterium]|nr:30S ribosomal protein S16 [Deltaproteobacteria bacterium]
MSVVIRLARFGRHKKPFYRIIVADKDMPRNGRFLEQVGTINTLTNENTIKLDEERVKYWVGVGAQPSDTVSQIIDKQIPGYLGALEEKRLAKIRSKRAARKARSGKHTKKEGKKERGKKAAPTAEKK